MQGIITTTFYVLTALLPLIFSPYSYEIFEFPKFIVLLAATIIIGVAWIFHATTTKDWSIPTTSNTRHQFLNISIIAIGVTQLISTVASIHPYTSFWGYYSRFHQGLLTTICYTILYFAAIKWLDSKSTQKIINISIKTTIFIGIIAILEHHNISITCLFMTILGKVVSGNSDILLSTNCWGGLTNPLNRSFATLGQPNWLAAYLIPHIFLILYKHLHSISKKKYLADFDTVCHTFYSPSLHRFTFGNSCFCCIYSHVWIIDIPYRRLV